MQVIKIYRVQTQRWRDREYDTYDHQILFEGNYIDKDYAEHVYKTRKDQLVLKVDHSVNLEEINVVLNPDGSYQEIRIIGDKKFFDTTPDLAYEKYKEEKIRRSALSKLTDEEKRVLGL